jgi:uncharacterized membrane protein
VDRATIHDSSEARPSLRFHARHLQLADPFGSGSFGRGAEAFARFFGTPAFLIGQTAIVAIWIVVNAIGIVFRWDPYPFILLNLAFSLQAAYAAPLILLAQTRQADRDKVLAIAHADHLDAIARENVGRQKEAAAQAERVRLLLESNTRLTEQTAVLGEQLVELTREIHAHVCVDPTVGRPVEGSDPTTRSSSRSMPAPARGGQPQSVNRRATTRRGK